MDLWSPRSLLRLSFAHNAKSLADRCRDQVAAAAEPGERLVEAALATARDADDLLVSAVAAERAGGVSWERIGEQLGCSRQAAQKRFGADVDYLRHAVLLPFRDGWFAGPSCAANPDDTAEQLDAWLRERPGSVGPSLSTLHDPTDSTELIAAVTELAQIATTAFGTFSTTKAPPGADERHVRQRLLEFTVAACEAITADERTSEPERTQASDELAQARAELAALHAQVAIGELLMRNEDAVTYFTYPNNDGDHQDVALLSWTNSIPAANIIGGWYLSPVGPDGHPFGDVETVSVEPDAARDGLASSLGVRAVARWIGRDLANDIGPFDEGGIVGPG